MCWGQRSSCSYSPPSRRRHRVTDDPAQLEASPIDPRPSAWRTKVIVVGVVLAVVYVACCLRIYGTGVDLWRDAGAGGGAV